MTDSVRTVAGRGVSLVMFGNTVYSGALVPYGRLALRAGWSKIWSGEEGLLGHLRSFKRPK